MERLTLKSPAKINLYLKILNKRPDGYHNLVTVFEKINLFDEISFSSRKDGRIKISCSGRKIPKNNSNLALRAALLLKEHFHKKNGVTINIKKVIPVGSGLGGGSSNAAIVLLGLNRLWRLGLKQKGLIDFAKRLGSDVAFFVCNCSFALATSRGDAIRPISGIRNKFWHVLVVIDREIPAKLAYDLWDKYQNQVPVYPLALPRKGRSLITTGFKAGKRHKISNTNMLTIAKTDVKIIRLALQQNSLTLFAKGLYNSFTGISQRICPEILETIKMMKAAGIEAVSMSGKGPAVFGVVSSRKEAIGYSRQLRGRRRQVLAVRTI